MCHVGIQRHNALAAEQRAQTGGPTLQRELRFNQDLAMLVHGLLNQTQHAAQWALGTFNQDRLLPQRDAFVHMRVFPLGGAIRRQPLQ